jgi:signal transduction histidine kinase
MGEMISAIAHQWRQPLNSLGIMVQDTAYTYTDNDMNEEYIKEFVKKAMQQINFMSKTIDDFRNFLKPDKEKTIFAPSTKIKEIIDILSIQLKSHDIQISLLESQGVIEGYDKEFGQVILNILNNAKDALIQNKTASPSITVTESVQNNRFIISIEDNAGGIPEDIIGRVFEPYFSTKEEGKGTGIGLYISKMIIESNMGGAISAENVESGARFVIELPLHALAA